MSVQIKGYGQRNQVAEEAPKDGGESLARETVTVARQKAAEALRSVRVAEMAAANANRKLATAEGKLRTKEETLRDQGPKLGPAAEQVLVKERDAAKAEVNDAREKLTQANTRLEEAEKQLADADKKVADIEQTANKVLKQLGKGEPFQGTTKQRDAYDRGQRSTPGENLTERDQAKLFAKSQQMNGRQAAAFTNERMNVAAESRAWNAATILEEAVLQHPEPAFREALLSSIGEKVAKMADELSEPHAATEEGMEECAAEFASLCRSAETLGGKDAQPLAREFARGLKEQQLKGQLGEQLKRAILEGRSGTTFAVLLASALGSAGKPVAAEEVMKATAEAVDMARARFERAKRKAQDLNAKLAKKIKQQGKEAGSSETQELVRNFKEEHGPEYAQTERSADQLGGALAGCGLALDQAERGGLPKSESTAELIEQSVLALGHVAELGDTAAGRGVLAQALDVQWKGERGLLDMVPGAARRLAKLAEAAPEKLSAASLDPMAFGKDGKELLAKLGQRLTEVAAPELVALRDSGCANEAVALAKTLMERNASLLGITPKVAAKLAEAMGEMVKANRPMALQEALTAFFAINTDDQPGLAANSAQVRALGLVMALPTLLLNVTQSRAAPYAQVLRRSAKRLELGPEGLAVVMGVLRSTTVGAQVAELLTRNPDALTRGRFFTKLAEALDALADGLGGHESDPDDGGPDRGGRFIMELANVVTSAPDSGVAQAVAETLLFPSANGGEKAQVQEQAQRPAARPPVRVAGSHLVAA